MFNIKQWFSKPQPTLKDINILDEISNIDPFRIELEQFETWFENYNKELHESIIELIKSNRQVMIFTIVGYQGWTEGGMTFLTPFANCEIDAVKATIKEMATHLD